MGPSLKIAPKPKTLIKRLFSLPLTKRVAWRYLPADHLRPKDAEEASRIIRLKGDLSEHPATVRWHYFSPYTGAIYQALKEVDNDALQKAFPQGAENIPSMYVSPYVWGIQAMKFLGSLFIMTHKFDLPYIGAAGTPPSFSNAFLYLSLNAMRNIVSDLVPKHGFMPLKWVRHLDHIKINKLTDSLLVTAFSFPILYFIKDSLHLELAGKELEWLATPLCVAAVDGLVQFVTRIERGFSSGVAKRDILRPFIGDIFATGVFYFSGLDYGMNFSYLLLRKVFAELWSGYVEGRDKRAEKMNEREGNLRMIFSLGDYNVPDPPALAALNLVYLLRVKSVSGEAFQRLLVEAAPSREAALKLKALHEALSDDKRIEETVRFVFPLGTWKAYADRMIEEFRTNRIIYIKWLKKHEEELFRSDPGFEKLLSEHVDRRGAAADAVEEEEFDVEPGKNGD